MINVKNLEFAYPGTKELILKKINFEIGKGEIFGFLGPSGAGKSTAQKLLYKTFDKYTGKIEIEGRDLREWGKDYFEKIGVGFELPNHYEKLSGRENMELFASFYASKNKNINELFAMVDLEEAVNKPVESYSKGMKMRLNFIRAIQHNPDIMYFDEPTSGLDPVNARKIRQHILDFKKAGKTVFITTHSMHTADELCDRVAFMVNGELRIIDKPEVLKRRYGKEAVRVELKNGEAKEFLIKDIGNNVAFQEFLRSGEVLRINTLEASLDEVFIKVTGTSLKI